MTDLIRSKRRNGKTPRDRLIEGEAMLQDRTMGLSLAQLMEKYGYSKPTVIKRLDEAIAARIPTTVDAYREQQNAAIDLAMRKLGQTLEAADIMIEIAIETKSIAGIERAATMRLQALRTLEVYLGRRAKLNGLDAPQKVEGTLTIQTQEDLAIQELIRETEARIHAEN
jgi:hypothetical protein